VCIAPRLLFFTQDTNVVLPSVSLGAARAYYLLSRSSSQESSVGVMWKYVKTAKVHKLRVRSSLLLCIIRAASWQSSLF
jgi:hypothetical protein